MISQTKRKFVHDNSFPYVPLVRPLNGLHYMAFVHIFRWRSYPKMLQARANFAAVWVPDGRLFVIGGNDARAGATATVEMLSCSKWETEPTAQGDWSFVAPLPKARQSHAAAFLGGKLIVAGGAGECGVEVFTLPTSDNPTGHWTSIAPLPEPTGMLALIPGKSCLIGICMFFEASI